MDQLIYLITHAHVTTYNSYMYQQTCQHSMKQLTARNSPVHSGIISVLNYAVLKYYLDGTKE